MLAEVGPDVRGWRPGERVTAPFVNACGRCGQCRAGEQQVCARPAAARLHPLGVVRRVRRRGRAPRSTSSAARRASTRRRRGARLPVRDRLPGRRAGRPRARRGVGGGARLRRGRDCPRCGGGRGGARVVAVDVRRAALDLAPPRARRPPSDRPADDRCAAAASGRCGRRGRRVARRPRQPGDLRRLGARASRRAGGTCRSACCRRPGPARGADAPRDLRELEVLGSHGMAAWRYPEMLGLVAAGRLRPGDLVTSRIA